jgi:hypothetical protein
MEHYLEFKNNFNGFLKDDFYFGNLSLENKKEYLILNEIYKPLKKNIFFVYKNLNYPYRIDVEIELDILSSYRMNFRGIIYQINDEIIDEIYFLLENFAVGSASEKSGYSQQKHGVLIEKLLTKFEIKNYIFQQHSKYFKKFKKDKNSQFYILEKNVDVNWRNYVQTRIYLDFDLVKKYLFELYYFDLTDFKIAKSWFNLCHFDEMMAYFKNYEIKDENNIIEYKISLPKSIAMLKEVGFFELEKIKRLTINQQAKIISFIQQKENNNSNSRAVSGNIRVLEENNTEDGIKYTSHKHLKLVAEIIKNLK